jgi:hypothetical protein
MSESDATKAGGEPLPDSVKLPSIFEHVRRHLRTDGPGLTEGGNWLPDEDLLRQQHGGLGWSGGALEGVLRHHTRGQPDPQSRVEELYQALIELAEQPDSGTQTRVRHLFLSPSVQNRSAAVGALANWSMSDLTAEIREALAGLRSDPDKHVRAACLELLGRIEKEQKAEWPSP